MRVKKKKGRCNLKRIPFFWDMAELLNTKIIINSFAEEKQEREREKKKKEFIFEFNLTLIKIMARPSFFNLFNCLEILISR